MATRILKTCNSSFEAEIIKGALAAEGIPCILQGNNMSILEAGFSMRPGFAVNVLVDEKDMDEALQIVDANDEN
ncbi:MAG: DUF2007 domain-containing protein [Bacteroidaceae bacterium]|nr:DUF2007 domain-containing protein [Bacteroidaceae bacterium]